MMHIRFRRYLTPLCVAVVLVFCVRLAPQERSPSLRILFLGNSYTYFNNLPEIFTKLAQAGNQVGVETRMIAPGGWRLLDHWEKGEARKVLRESKWDIVILQEQSTLGMNFYIDGRIRIAGDQVFRPYAEKWVSEIRQTGAIPMLYSTWARKATPEDQAALNYAYMRAAGDLDAQIAPVGSAWEKVRKQHPSLELYYVDGSHPSRAGTYLAACTFYAAIFHKSPVGLPGQIRGILIDPETAKKETEKIAVLVGLSAEQAVVLQNAAWDAWRQLDKARGRVSLTPVPLPSLAQLPKGARLRPVDLEGMWSGDLRLYPPPFLPAQMELNLHQAGDSLSGHLVLRYHSKDQPDQTLDLDDLRVDERQLSFSDPKAAQGLTIQFRGVKTGTGELRGHAEASPVNPNSSVRLLGTWQLRRK